MPLEDRLEAEKIYHSNIEQVIENVGNCKLLCILAGFYASKIVSDDEDLTQKRLELIINIQSHLDDISDLLSQDRVLFNKEEAELLIRKSKEKSVPPEDRHFDGDYHFAEERQ